MLHASGAGFLRRAHSACITRPNAVGFANKGLPTNLFARHARRSGLHSLARSPLKYPAARSLGALPLLRVLSRGLSTSGLKTNSTANPEAGVAEDKVAEDRDLSILRKLRMHPDQLEAKEGFNRWLLMPAAMVNHLCLGSVFAWSIFNEPMTRLLGVVAPAAGDWTLGATSITFSLVMGGFAWGAILGRYLDRWGPRASCLIGATSLGSGFGLAALAMHTQSLPLLYLGGAVWGLANGWAYVPPVSTLLKWFPDRKGLAAGSCILGYGGGAMIAAPVFTRLLEKFRQAPEYLGKAADVNLVNEGGKLFANVGGTLQEAIVATSAQTASWGLDEGVYLVGTGSTGMAETFTVLGSGFCAAMLMTSFTFRTPWKGYKPEGMPEVQPAKASALGHDRDSIADPPKAEAPQLTTHNVAVDVATRSKEFWVMWSGFGLAVTGAYGILSMGKTMLNEAFAVAYPDVVTAGFCATFVGLMSAANMGGRVFWSNTSDFLANKFGGDPFWGRRAAFSGMWGIGPPLYLATVWSVHNSFETDSVVPLVVFSGSVMGILASFGGTAATRPALCGDLFGTKNVGVLTARQLSVVLPAAFLGPRIATYFRETSIVEAIYSLAAQVENSVFEATFGMGKESLDLLIEQKTVTIGRLLELLPEGTIDPTPFVYDKTMYVMATLQTLAFASNLYLKPMDPKFHMKDAEDELTPSGIPIPTTKAP